MSCVVFTLQKFLIVIISIRLRFEVCTEIDSVAWPGGITEGRNTQTEVPHRSGRCLCAPIHSLNPAATDTLASLPISRQKPARLTSPYPTKTRKPARFVWSRRQIPQTPHPPQGPPKPPRSNNAHAPAG